MAQSYAQTNPCADAGSDGRNRRATFHNYIREHFVGDTGPHGTKGILTPLRLVCY